VAVGFVRPARPDDVGEIARVQLTTWRVACRRLIAQHLLDRIDPEWITGRWHEAIATPPSAKHRVLVAVERSESPVAGSPSEYLVGFAASGPADDAALAPDEHHTSLGPDVAAVTDLLVEPRWTRRGHGSRLMAAAVEIWRIDRFRTAVAWAFADDIATRRFLEGSGWAPDGARRWLDVDDLLVPQVRLHVALGDDAEPSDEPPVIAM
jgi:GNAT superfamily N-acetyltransferase